jgi:hypothetical protein
MAAVHLGMLLTEQGDPVGARAEFQWAMNSGHAKWSPMAAVHLGMLLTEQGDPIGARAAYQWVINSSHAERGPKQH